MFPTDAKLLNRERERLVRLAAHIGVELRQSYARVGKLALIKHQRYVKRILSKIVSALKSLGPIGPKLKVQERVSGVIILATCTENITCNSKKQSM